MRQSQNYKEQQKTSKVIYMQYEDHDWLYFSAKLLDGNFLITEISAESLKIILEGSASWENKLNAIRIGASGYVFSVSKKDFTIQSHPEENLVGRDIFECGIKEKCIYSQQLQWFEFEHQKLYGKIMETEDLYLFAVVPSGEIYSNVLYITIIIIILYIIVNSTIFLYAYYSSKQATEQACFIEIGEDGEIGIVQDTVNIGNINNFFFDRRLIRKYNVYSMIGLLVVFFGTLFLQQILSISELSVSCQYAGRGVLDEIAMHEKKMEQFQNIYNQEYLELTKFATQLVSDNSELKTREKIGELSIALGVTYVYIFDDSGKVILTNSPSKNFVLSEDPQERSYEFRNLLNGYEYLIQEPKYNENGVREKQYIGVALRDSENYLNGFLEIAFVPKEMNELADNMNISKILSQYSIGIDGQVFAVSKEDNTFVYSPNALMIGQHILKYGVSEQQLAEGANGYITIGKEQYYSVVNETPKYYLFTVANVENVKNSWFKLPFLIVFCSLLNMILIGIVFNYHKEEDLYKLYGMQINNEPVEEIEEENKNVSKKTPKSKAEIAMEYRWNIKNISWEHSSAEQKAGFVLKLFILFFAIFIAVIYIMGDNILSKDSIVRYIISGNWEKRVSIFSVTACIMNICVIIVALYAIQKILFLIAKVSNTRIETICHLVYSCSKYIAGILVIYLCFSQFGVDAQTLLASAGILTLIIGLASKDIITDVIAGLFIILEDEFKVGDFVEIDGYMGIVKLIGVRVTKIERNGQTKIINNSNIKGVINMSGEVAKANCVVGIDYKESLERVEDILSQELPLIEDNIPGAIGAPFYRGVTHLGVNSVEIKISVICAGYMKIKAQYALNREIKLIFDKYNIHIPYQQIIVNEPYLQKDV